MTTHNTKATNQRIKSIALDDLAVGNYQRPTNTAQVNNIAIKFDESKLGLLVVNYRDGKYQLLDGAHRAAALRQIGYTHVMCVVLEGLTYQEEADYFRRQNENSRKLTIYHMFQAGLESGDEMCCKIRDIAANSGWTIGTSGRGRGRHSLQAINALFVICKVYGYDILDRTLTVLRDCWDYDEMSGRREFLIGTADFINRFGEADFVERLKNVSLSGIWRKYIELSEFTNRATASQATRTAFCESLVFHYNRGLVSKKRLIVQRGDAL